VAVTKRYFVRGNILEDYRPDAKRGKGRDVIIIIDLGEDVYVNPAAITAITRTMGMNGERLNVYTAESDTPIVLQKGGEAYKNMTRLLEQGIEGVIKIVRMSEGDNV
jgi:hypothetical protein